MPHPAPRRRRRLVVACLTLAALVLILGFWRQRSLPDLAPWHTVDLDAEFVAEDDDGNYDWGRYLATEDLLFRQLDERIVANSGELANPNWNRFAPAGTNNPATFPRNWNRSYELPGTPGGGGALLIHGLTDSPYSLRRTAEVLNEQGVYVVGLRLPGHGTAPGALRKAEAEDWRAAVRIACRHLQEVVGPDQELTLVGYSNGAALSLDYALDSLEDDALRSPDRLILFSPAVGITPAAALARAHRLLSFMPWFNKLAWSGIEPELDPFKYSSFPTDAGYQTHVLTRSVRRRLAQLDNRQYAQRFPPVLTFMSLADATVLVQAVVEGLYERLAESDNEIVIFDINRQAKMTGLYRTDPALQLQALRDRPTTSYRLTVISDVNDTSPTLEEWTRAPGATVGEVTPLDLEWPRGFYSLSHVAVPFPSNDPTYGFQPDPGSRLGIELGTLEPRGENGLLVMSPAQLTRLRSNPFFPYIERRLVATIRGATDPPPPRREIP